jgi:alkaline phosphatase
MCRLNLSYKVAILCLLFSLTNLLQAQPPVFIHSHNDYHQTVPFYQAYAQMLDSYEADVFYDKSTQKVLVAHGPEEIRPENTLDELYIQPIVKQFKLNNGKAWKNSDKSFYLMIDIKANPDQVVPAVLKLTDQYPDVFRSDIHPNAVKLVFTGEIPEPKNFSRFPIYVSFDGNLSADYTEEQLKRVAFFSDSFQRYSVWNGKGSIVPIEKQRLMAAIDKAHAMHKMIRFWGSPDNLNTWQIFRNMRIDIINTDHPEKCTDFFRNELQHNFSFGKKNNPSQHEIIRPDKLDKATKNFSGFDENSLSLDSCQVYYKPTGRNDGKPVCPKNIILLIGDGMGLTQLAATDLVNNGLSITQMKYTGFARTQAKGNFITDSAGAGSALATGKKTPNRAIATDGAGHPNPSITEILLPEGKSCGIVTNGNIADATPAVFYGHADERDNTDEITGWLTRTQPDFIAGSGHTLFTDRKDGRSLKNELQNNYQFIDSVNQPCEVNKKVILLDERLSKATTRYNLPLLSQTAAMAINKLNINNKGFFLMIEGAKIDYAGHANSFPASIIETLGFDLAVQQALRFADSNGETLVIVTADHETGGLSLIDGDKTEGRISGVYASDDHTPVFVPVLAYGPGANEFTGVYENTEIFHKIIQLILPKSSLKK